MSHKQLVLKKMKDWNDIFTHPHNNSCGLLGLYMSRKCVTSYAFMRFTSYLSLAQCWKLTSLSIAISNLILKLFTNEPDKMKIGMWLQSFAVLLCYIVTCMQNINCMHCLQTVFFIYHTLSGNKLTCNLLGNTQPWSSWLTEPLCTDPGLKSVICVCKLISTEKAKQNC